MAANTKYKIQNTKYKIQNTKYKYKIQNTKIQIEAQIAAPSLPRQEIDIKLRCCCLILPNSCATKQPTH